MEYGERFNTYTHLIGALLALAGGAVLIVLGALSGDVWKIVSFSIYAATLLSLYGASTLYHNARAGRIKNILRKFDHNAIYLLIAGSYTPFTLVSLRGPWGWSLFGVVWGLALLGIFQELWFAKKSRWLSMLIYILMGWVAIVAILPLLEMLGTPGFLLLAAGGVAYTGGIIFYLYDERFRHWHGIWHLFVLAGSALHYCAILFYVA
ncbi:MAG: hemolysin III family protein [Sideroxydans sp.]|jgi:hemolysin III